ncbi:MAG: sulfite exporter TauE/SafE family protein [Clostridia bacterium]|nr:sulfite exporter TauE/SafE family protein [Clostridia bacterium]
MVGIIGGIIGGMGMGGGTLLIPLLTAFCAFDQHTAQAVNLIAFVPMSVASIVIHAKNKLLKPRYLLSVALPAVIVCIPASILALNVDGKTLSVIFGWFLMILGVIQLTSVLKKNKRN